jgi:peptidylprolyl isomerase
MPQTRRWPSALGVATVSVSLLALAGCGSSSGSSATTTTSPSSTSSTSSSGSPSPNAAGTSSPNAAGPTVGITDPSPAGTFGTKPTVVVPPGAPPTKLETSDLIVGTGATATAGQKVTVQYVGVAYSTGKQFDASWDRGQAFPFTLGAGQVIPGWDQGVVGMRVGGRRELIIPPNLAYGAQPPPGSGIASNDTLIFVVDLVKIG